MRHSGTLEAQRYMWGTVAHVGHRGTRGAKQHTWDIVAHVTLDQRLCMCVVYCNNYSQQYDIINICAVLDNHMYLFISVHLSSSWYKSSTSQPHVHDHPANALQFWKVGFAQN